jgi:hypothetical protein
MTRECPANAWKHLVGPTGREPVTTCVSCAFETSGKIRSGPYTVQLLSFRFVKHRIDSSRFAGVADGVADGSITSGVRVRSAGPTPQICNLMGIGLLIVATSQKRCTCELASVRVTTY